MFVFVSKQMKGCACSWLPSLLIQRLTRGSHVFADGAQGPFSDGEGKDFTGDFLLSNSIRYDY